MPNDGVLQLPYPAGSAIPDGPGAILALTNRLNVMSGSGIARVANAAALAALVTNGDAFTNLFVCQVDTGAVYRYTGSVWQLWSLPETAWTPASITNVTVGTGGTKTGWYSVNNGVVTFSLPVVLGTSPAVGGRPTVPVPIGAVAHAHRDSGGYVSIGSTSYPTMYSVTVANTIELYVIGAAGTYASMADMAAAVPASFAAGSTLNFEGSYRLV